MSRLIDADALKEILSIAIPLYPIAGAKSYADTDVFHYIDCAPTIIPEQREADNEVHDRET